MAVAVLAPVRLPAQDVSLQARRFTVEDGLAQNQVQSIVQDRAGFMWIGTRRGLQRFDGYSFTPYSSLDPAAPAELSSPINHLHIDGRGRLWVRTAADFFRIDLTARRATRMPVGAMTWAFDSEERLWFVDRGAVKWISVDDEAAEARVVAGDSGWRNHNAIAVSRGTVWLTSPGELRATVTRMDLATGTTRRYDAAAVTTPIALTVDSSERVWLLAQDGLEVLDPGAGQFRSLELFRDKPPTNLEPDGRGGFLIATDGWLVRLDEAGQVTERWDSPDVFGIGVLPSAVELDREGGVWLGTVTSGLIRLDLKRPPFDYRSSRSVPRLPLANDFITATFERRDGTLWVGTFRGGVYRIAADWSEVRGFRHDPRNTASIAADEIWDIEEDARGNLWVATSQAMCRAVGEGFRCLLVPRGAGGVTSIGRDDAGMFWLGMSPSGVLRFDPATERFGPTVPGLPRGHVIAIFHDSGYLWLGKGELLRLPVKNGEVAGPVEQIRTVRGADPSLFDFHRDRAGRLWIGTDEGLQVWSRDSGGFSLVQAPELRGTTVFSIAEDDKGRLWLGTAHGLAQYSPERGTARRYTRRDGFLSGELNRHAALRRRNGEMLFGGIEGLTQFDPEFVTGPRAFAPVALTRWRKVTSDGPADAWIDGMSELRVEPRDRAFTIEFAALAFSPGPSRRYRYRLDALNSDWIETTEHLATYSTPRPGRYVFRVQTASGAEGEWSSPGTAVTIDVIPPFWATSWFRALLGVMALGALGVAHRMRLRQALATERLRLQISRDLHDEIGAGLSSIALLSDSVGTSEGVTARDRSQLQKIAGSARGMVADLRDIVWAIDPEGDRLEDVVSRMKDVATDLLRDVEVSFHAPPSRELADRISMSARRDLLLLFKELLHNASRHSRARAVRIALEARPGLLELVIADDGVGFDPNDVRSGTGLKSLHERAARLGGRLDVSSERGRGTTARLSIRRT